MLINKIFFLLIFFSLLNFNLFAQDIDVFIGKKIILTWGKVSCETNFFEWREVSSNCYDGSYKLKVITQNDGLKYFWWGPIPSKAADDTSFWFDGVTYFNDGTFASLVKVDSPDAQWEISKPEIKITNINYSGENIIKKNMYDFQISLLDTLIYLEKNSETSNNKEIEKFLYCKNNLPTDFVDNIEEFKEVNFSNLNKDLKIFSKVALTDEGEESMDRWLEIVMSNSEEPDTLPEAFHKISSVENFLAIFGGMMGFAFSCEMFD